MTILISQTVWAEIAHSMTGHPVEENRRIHGHSIKVTVSAERPGRLQDGQVMDFSVYRSQVEAIVGLLDHRHINVDFPEIGEPTLENIAEWIGVRMGIAGPLRTVSVKIEREHLGQAAEWLP